MNIVEVIPLGGVGEIGKNCTAIRQGDDIVVIDVGLSFPNEEMPGVDIVIPDFTYLVEHRDKIRGVFLTHAHEDHVGSLPYLLHKVDVPVYATEFTHALIAQKLEEKLGHKKLDLRTFKPGDVIKCGTLEVEPIRVTHSIPETCAMAIRTIHGIVLMTADFKFDFTPVDKKLTNMGRLGELGKEGVVLLLSDSTNVDRPGWGPSEITVKPGIKRVFETAPGRIFLTTFASNIHRMQQVYDVAAEMGRCVAVVGRRMESNVETCIRLGYLKIPKGVRVNLDEAKFIEPDKLAILTTGSQGEPFSALVQMSKEEYGRMKLVKGDTLIYSARPIPGNEAAIWRTINRLFRMGVTVHYDRIDGLPVHVSGHAYQEEIKMMINLTQPYYLAPVHGEPRHQHLYLSLGRAMGYPEHRLFTMEEGRPLCLGETDAFLGDQVPCGRVLVDGAGTPGVADDILRDRHTLGKDGVVAITIAIDPDLGELVGEPAVSARGFNGDPKILEIAASIVRDGLVGLSPAELKDADYVRHQAGDLARRFFTKRTGGLRPMVIPTIIEV